MVKSLIAVAAAAAALAALPTTPAFAHPHEKESKSECCDKQQLQALPGENVDGYHIPNYVFIYADLDNDGVLKGRELRRAVNRVIRMESGGDRYR